MTAVHQVLYHKPLPFQKNMQIHHTFPLHVKAGQTWQWCPLCGPIKETSPQQDYIRQVLYCKRGAKGKPKYITVTVAQINKIFAPHAKIDISFKYA